MAPGSRCKIFIDSNVLLSGIFSDKGAPRIILDLLTLKLPMLSGATGQYNLMEVERNLQKKMPEALTLWHEYLSRLGIEIVALPSRETVQKMAGVIAEKDIPVLASAMASGADYLITGDQKDFSGVRSDETFTMTIMNPSEFIEKVMPEILMQKE